MPGPVAYVIGAGPNGLSAAIHLLQSGWTVTVIEMADTVGGGCRTDHGTLPGYRHDVCSAIHPMARISPFFKTLGLERFGLEWVEPPVEAAHPLPGGDAVLLHRSVAETAADLGPDEKIYRHVMGTLVKTWPRLAETFLGPLQLPPPHPLSLLPFGLLAPLPAAWLASHFRSPRLRALFCGMAAHSVLSLRQFGTTAYALMLALGGHIAGWAFPRGGAANLTRALAACFESQGGRIILGYEVTTLDELPSHDAVLLDVSPSALVRLAGGRVSGAYRKQVRRFRHGAASFKVDYALRHPIPWTAPTCALAATVHVGGTWDEVVASEEAVSQGRVSDTPFVLLAQHSLFDPSRAPAGRHTAWAYCHLPNGSDEDCLMRIENQIERFAPGFSETILARRIMRPIDLAQYNPNYVGGDIAGGAGDLRQLFTRPAGLRRPYATGANGVYLCSSSTPPGGGVHGMCGFHAAELALADRRVR